MVCEVHQFKKWGVIMEEIKRFRTKTIDLVGTNPYDGTHFAHSIRRADGRIIFFYFWFFNNSIHAPFGRIFVFKIFISETF